MKENTHKLDCPTFVITVRFGKEKPSIYEVGDALFPLDQEVRVSLTKFKGVLVIYTKLSFHEVLTILKKNPPAYIERIVKVDRCCNIADLRDYVVDLLETSKVRISSIRFGRKGSLSKDLMKAVEREVIKYIDRSSNIVLHIEPINGLICLGLMKVGDDKFYMYRFRKIGFNL
jgi:tRNA(Ser,Leu) C12 N-acetylase TAN1